MNLISDTIGGTIDFTGHPQVDTGLCLNRLQRRSFCTTCATLCPHKVFPFQSGEAVNWARCTDCTLCVSACPSRALIPSPQTYHQYIDALQEDGPLRLTCRREEQHGDMRAGCLASLPWELLALFALKKELILYMRSCEVCPLPRQYQLLTENLQRVRTFLGEDRFARQFRQLHAGDTLPGQLQEDSTLPQQLHAGDALPNQLNKGDLLPGHPADSVISQSIPGVASAHRRRNSPISGSPLAGAVSQCQSDSPVSQSSSTVAILHGRASTPPEKAMTRRELFSGLRQFLVKQAVKKAEKHISFLEDTPQDGLWIRRLLADAVNLEIQAEPPEERGHRNFRLSLPRFNTSCFGCGICEKICPHKALSIVREENNTCLIYIESWKCSACSLCVKLCPHGGLDGIEPAALPHLEKVPLVRVKSLSCIECGAVLLPGTDPPLCRRCAALKKKEQRDGYR